MAFGAVRAICFDLDNTLWEIEPVLLRAERILADWLLHRYPLIPQRFSSEALLALRASLLREQPHQAHDLTYLRRETLARAAEAVGYDSSTAGSIGRAAFDAWHAARNQVTPYAETLPALAHLGARFRLATLSNGNADLARIGLAHHFEVSLDAGSLGCGKPDPRAYSALAAALTLEPSEILFVGDDPQADVVGPRAAGMQTVWVNRLGQKWPESLSCADASIVHIGQLVDLLAET
ncbi:MAG TPA: HAD family hydrolase [Steroidobacteraceae bacterium]|nr:HAD family hydrolase [Steroidobacteraceae bacterium]